MEATGSPGAVGLASIGPLAFPRAGRGVARQIRLWYGCPMARTAPAPATVDLHDLERDPPPAIGENRAPGFVEAAGVCLTSAGHKPGIALDLRQGEQISRISLRWSLRKGAAHSWDEIESTADGAVAVGLSLLRHTMGLNALERGRIPSGFDYWLGTPEGVYKAIVEISGIRHGTESQISARLRQKKDQIQNSHGKLTAYALVVEFSRPRADVELR